MPIFLMPFILMGRLEAVGNAKALCKVRNTLLAATEVQVDMAD